MPYSSGVNGLPENEVERELKRRGPRSRYSSGVKRDPEPESTEASPEKTRRRARGTGFNSREPFELPAWMQGRQIGRGTKSSREASTGDNPVRPSQPPTPDQEPELATEVTAITADEVRENSNGMVQTGRNMSSLNRGDDNMPYIQGKDGLLDRVGLGPNATLNSGWASNQLPGTNSSLYGGNPVSKQLGEGPENVKLTNNLAESGGATQNLEGMPEEAFAATQPGDGRPTLFSDARTRAFLDTPGSMAGKRAMDAQLGRFRAGGDYHYTNPNAGQEGEPEFIKVSTDTARQHQYGQITGQQLLAKHMDRVIQDNPAAADSPSPAEFSPDMSEGQFAAYQATGGSQKGFTPDMEEDDFIAMQKM